MTAVRLAERHGDGQSGDRRPDQERGALEAGCSTGAVEITRRTQHVAVVSDA